MPAVIRLLYPITLLRDLVTFEKLGKPFFAVDPVPWHDNSVLAARDGHKHFAGYSQKFAKPAHGVEIPISLFHGDTVTASEANMFDC